MTTTDALGNAHDTTSGRFIAREYGRPAEVELRFSSEGSFLYPPERWESTDGDGGLRSYLDFWSRVEISDGVLGNVTTGYAELIRHEASLDSSQWTAHFNSAHYKVLNGGSETAVRRVLEQRDSEWEAHFAEWASQRHMRIRPNDVRAIARAGQLWYFSGSLPEEAQTVIWESTMRVNDSETTVGRVYTDYRLEELREYFQDPETTAAEKLEDLRLELRRMQQPVAE
ncbi:hypothetical protein [Frigoribacterium sp. SL97]|uniref:hypothetical protein n=1 Tax=Frigoribacterium sp. SL97 TaxID=2994664 RepID=UPI00226EE184|nr:hypothetical protein [Frigoribacterium sp. SL97]WAC50295.1 hypothetical protein OVA02_10370 [Frigoribacterium sp. SL97]